MEELQAPPMPEILHICKERNSQYVLYKANIHPLLFDSLGAVVATVHCCDYNIAR